MDLLHVKDLIKLFEETINSVDAKEAIKAIHENYKDILELQSENLNEILEFIRAHWLKDIMFLNAEMGEFLQPPPSLIQSISLLMLQDLMSYNFLGTSRLEREHFLLIYGENMEAEELEEYIDENLDKAEIFSTFFYFSQDFITT